MKKLWLSAIAAVSLLTGTVAEAGDRGRHHDHWDRGHHYEHRRCDHDRGHRGWHHHGHYRPVVNVVRPVVYSRPVYYEPRPVYYDRPYYGRDYGRGDGEVHGSITVGF